MTIGIFVGGSFFSFSGILYHYGREKDASLPMYNKPMEFYAGKGALLIKKKVLKKLTAHRYN